MNYVICDKETTIIVKAPNGKSLHNSVGAAKAALTRMVNSGQVKDRSTVEIHDYQYFCQFIEKKKTVKNMMSGRPVEISVNTPHCCDPSTETYWSQ